MRKLRRDWRKVAEGDSRPLESVVHGSRPGFAERVVDLLGRHERIHAMPSDDGVVISTVWHPDLDEADAIIRSEFSEGVTWDVPRIRLRYETVKLEGGRSREIVLEPYLLVQVSMPEDCSGLIAGDLSSRRGQIVGMEKIGDDRWMVGAQVPLSQLSGYPKRVAGLSGERAIARASFLHYQEQEHPPGPDSSEPMSAALKA